MQTSADILDHFQRDYVKDIDLTLRPAYRRLLAALGDPHLHMPPAFHVAGTNGKGSTCAFLRAMLEAAGKCVHVYTSPHLVCFHERVRVAGEIISEDALRDILAECLRFAEPHGVSYFEVATAAAFAVFARTPADYTIVEVGLGGRLDATNVIPHPLATIITRLSYDHREFLGNSLREIAGEKAGIMKQGTPCYVAPQPDDEAIVALRDAAREENVALHVGGDAWRIVPHENSFVFEDATRRWQLPAPALWGEHQFANAGLAIAALASLPEPLLRDAVVSGLQNVEWPARLQRLTKGALVQFLPQQGWELWLDGGHNDSAGEVLAAQIARWRTEDSKPLHIITGMLTSKKPEEFFAPFVQPVASVQTLTIPDAPQSFRAEDLAVRLQAMGVERVNAATSLQAALHVYDAEIKIPARILICGSLYLAGHVLTENGA